MTTTFCLDCEREIELDLHPEVGQQIRCQHCEIELEIINLDPLQLDWVYNGPAKNFQQLDLGWWGSNWASTKTHEAW